MRSEATTNTIGTSMRIKTISGVLGLALVGLLMLGTTSASADISFCAFGSGPGQCDHPAGVAVDRSSGRVYVADSYNDRVNVFDENGNFLEAFGSSGAGSGQLLGPSSIAVDNVPISPNFHDVYVTDESLRVQRFDQSGVFEAAIGVGQLKGENDLVSIGPGGDLYVLDSNGSVPQLKIFDAASASLTSASTLPSAGWTGLAADSSGDFYISHQRADTGLEKYEPTEPVATLISSLSGGSNTTAIAVDDEDNLFVAQQAADKFLRLMTKRNSSGNIVKSFAYEGIDFNLGGLAVGAGGNLFGSEVYAGLPTAGNRVIRIQEPGPGPLACCLETIRRNTSATLKGAVNPEGKSTTYHFEYISDEDYAANGGSFEGANPAAVTPESPSVGSDFDLHDVEAKVGCAKVEVPAQADCLEPDTAYHFRLVATNADGGSNVEGVFTTLPPLDIEGIFVTDVGFDAGRLHALVNPLGIPATGYFEYVDDVAFQADLAKGAGHDGFAQALQIPNVAGGRAPINLGEGEGSKEVAVELPSLADGTTYHYRFVATNPFILVRGDEGVFRTFPRVLSSSRICPNEQFRVAASAALPECRAYEMVSPVDKNGNDIKVLVSGEGYPARLDQSSDDGERFTYSSSTAFGDAPSAPWTSQYLATRQEGEGWSTQSLNPPRDSVSFSNQAVMKLDLQYKFFNSDLTSGWLFHDTEPTLDECAPPGEVNLYRRDLETGEYEAILTTEAEDIANAANGYRLEIQGISKDAARTVFRANSRLLKEAAKSNKYQIYEHIADEGCGELRLVSYMPNGKASVVDGSVGSGAQPGENRGSAVFHAVSADGSTVFMTLGDALVGDLLYVRVNADQLQSPVSGGKCTDPSLGCTLQMTTQSARYWTAAEDGSKAVYSINQKLYEFDREKALANEPASTLIADGVTGVVGESNDLSRLYFVSKEVLNGEGEAGKRNVYLREGDSTRLVATVVEVPDGTEGLQGTNLGTQRRISNGARTTADGHRLAFVSTAQLTDYDSASASDGGPVLEVYLYDADTDEVRCISCNPTGSRPRPRLFTKGGGLTRVSAYMAAGESQHFSPRALSADGRRLFFESFEALLPRDTNGKGDVYEWQQAANQQACEEVGAELYVSSAGGCLSLISSGQSPQDSEFADATPDGHDVFIRTASSLLPQDDGLVDIYDARIGGGFSQPPLPPAACEGEACQGPLDQPDDPTPASSAFEGSGNVKDEPVASCRKGKVRRKGRCVTRKTRKAGKAQKSQKRAKAHKKQKRRAD